MIRVIRACSMVVLAAGLSLLPLAADEAFQPSKVVEFGRAAMTKALALRGKPGQEQAMIDAYNEVIKYAKTAPAGLKTELEQACNNLGVYYSSQTKLDLAVQTFAKVPEPGSPDAFVFHFNYGRALEKAAERGDKESLAKAYDQYWASMRKQPAYARAADAISRLLLAETPPRYAEARKLIVTLTEADPPQVGAAEKHLTAFLSKWGTADAAPGLAAALVRLLVAAQVSPARYNTEYRPLLQKLDRPLVKTALGELDRLFNNREFANRTRNANPLLFSDADQARTEFPGWNQLLMTDVAAARDVSRLLTMAGDWYARQALAGRAGAPTPADRAALARYSAAFALDPSNAGAALAAATLLDDHADQLDADGSLLKGYIDTIYNGKMDLLKEALARGGKDEWARVYSCRVVLAALYARKKQWGDPTDYHSAIGQLNLAIDAEQQIQAKDPYFPASPLIRDDLGVAYRSKGDRAAAAAAFAESADGWVLTRDPKRARQAIETARDCGPDEALARRLDRLGQLSQVTPRAFQLAGRTPLTGFSKEGDVLKTSSSSDLCTFDLTTGQAEASKHQWTYDGQGVKTTFAPKTGAAAFKKGNSVFLYTNGKADRLDAAGDGRPLTSLNLSPNGKLLAAACADCVRIVDVGRRAEIRRVDKPGSGGGPVVFTQAGDRFAVAFGGRVVVWPSKEGPPAAEFALVAPARQDAAVTAVAFGPNGGLLALGASDGTVQLCSVPERKTLASFKSGPAPVSALAFSPDGRLLAAGDGAGVVRLYSPAERLPVGPLPGADGHVASLDFAAPGGKLALAVGVGKDGPGSEVRVFDLSSLK